MRARGARAAAQGACRASQILVDLMPVVVRDEIRNLERELGNQAAVLIRLP